MKLSVNGVLDVERRPNRRADLVGGQLEFVRSRLIHNHCQQFPFRTRLAFRFHRQPAAAQEAWARFDRQSMARDIFVLLYTFCGGADVNFDGDDSGSPTNTFVQDTAMPPLYPEIDPGNPYFNTRLIPDTSSNHKSDAIANVTVSNAVIDGGMPGPDDDDYRPVHSDERLREMAQFAVNLVDALDRDNVITRFEYDKNLADGWNLGDNAFQTMDDGIPAGDRGVVHGVEAQQLTLSEAMVIFAKESDTSADLDETEWDDSDDRHFAYVELRNASPYDSTHPAGVNFANEGWQIVLKVHSDTGANIGNHRRLNLLSGGVGAGGLFTIGTAGDNSVIDSSDGSTRYSQFKVDPNYTMDPPQL